MTQAPDNTDNQNVKTANAISLDIDDFEQLYKFDTYQGLNSFYEAMAQKRLFVNFTNGDKLDNNLYMTLKELNNFISETDDNQTVQQIAFLNPYFYALKKNIHFRNRNNTELVFLILQFLFVKGKEIFPKGREHNAFDFSRINPSNLSFVELPGYKKMNITFDFPFTPYVTKRLINELIDYANKFYQISDYYQMPQNTTFNAFIKSNTNNNNIAQLDFNNTGIIEVNKNFRLFIENYDGPISNNAKKCLDLFLIASAENPQNRTQIALPLREYMNKRGFKDISTARKSALDAMEELSRISYEAKEKIKGKDIKSGHVSFFGGTALIKKGIVYWNFNQDLLPQLENIHMMDINKKCFSLNDHNYPNAYYIARYIDLNYRINEGKERVNKISIRSIIDSCPNLIALYKTYQPKRYKEKIMFPFLRDINHVRDTLNYYFDILEPTGCRVDDPYCLSFSEFGKCFLDIDYSEHPQHRERIAKKHTIQRKVIAAAEKARIDKLAKESIENQN